MLDGVVSAHPGRVGREEPTPRRLMLDALAEFAAGAGHELNNPLAVIVGRAQLLLAREEDDPDAIRSLRAIIAQAQRAARILRDLMYVARPPEPRPRPCQPEEIVRACLRDLQGEAEARGVRIVAESREPGLRVWADPEPLRQIADILARNALEASLERRPGPVHRLGRRSGRSAGPFTTTAEGSARPRGCTSSTRSTAAGRRAEGWASACRGPPGSSPRRVVS